MARIVPRFLALLAVSAAVPLTLDAVGAQSLILPTGVVNQNYSLDLTTQTGLGGPNITWSGMLPRGLAGLMLSSAGLLQGVPTFAGSYSFVIQATGGDSPTTFFNATLTVNPPLSVSSPPPIEVSVGGSFSVSLSASGGLTPYTWTTAGTWPQGYSLSSSGAFSGAPSQPGNIGVTAQVTDSEPVSLSAGIQIYVLGLTTPSPLPAGNTVATYSTPIIATGGVPPYTYTATGLPTGLTLSSSGNLSGAVTNPATINFTVQVTDKAGFSSSSPYSLTINPAGPLSISSPSLSNGTVNVPYSATVTASGGNPPYQWALNGGALPKGMSLNQGGVITGTPTLSGTYMFTLQATDGSGATVATPATLVINPAALVIATQSPLSSGIVGSNYLPQILGATGGVSPYTFSITTPTPTGEGLPGGLTLNNGVISGTPTASGTFTVPITVQDYAGTTAQTNLSVNIRPTATDLLLSAGSLSFSLQTGANSLPASQTDTVNSNDASRILDFSLNVSPAAPWLSVTVSGNAQQTPATLTIGLTSQALALAAQTNPYQTTITVTCTSASSCPSAVPQTITVSLGVTTGPAVLNTTTTMLSYSTSSSPPAASTQPLVIQNTGGGSLGFISASCEASWCTVDSFPAALFSGSSESINITADPTGLPPGYYRTTVDIASSGGSLSVPATLLIAQASELVLAPAGTQIQMLAGSNPGDPNGSFLVSVAGSASLNWSASIVPPVTPGPNWLLINSSSGTASGSAPGTVSFSIDPNVAPTLSAGPYYANIKVTAAGAVNSPQYFEVVLNVASPSSTFYPDPSPAGLIFVTEAGSMTPPQTVQVYSSQSTGYQTSAFTNDPGNWLTVSPLTGNTTTTNAAQTEVSVDASSLSPGVYYGGVNYSFPGSGLQTVNVTLIVEPAVAAPSAVPGSVHGRATTSGCTPSTLAPAQTGLLNNFSAPASWPTPIAVLLMDDCANPVSNGQIIVTFTNGDPPLALGLANSTTALYSGTWTPRNTGSQVSLSAQASAPGFAGANLTITGAVVPNTAPTLATKGTLHAFNPQIGAPMAPGTIVQIYGSGLASGIASASTIPLPTTLNGTSVIIGGIPAPLYFVSPGQINAQLPFELDPTMQYQVIASANGALTAPVTIQLAPVTPGFAAYGTGGLIAQHFLDGALITDASPAQPGEIVVAYLAGLGDTTVPVEDGAGAPTSPLAYAAVTPVLTLNGTQVPFYYAGLVPGLVGLYQLDFQIPVGTPNGTLNVVLTQDSFGSNSTTIPVQQQ